ncbi:MAG TPA: hypothetical protein VJK05_05160 [archaeon]|nr:hypothetical protein [archaeon]
MNKLIEVFANSFKLLVKKPKLFLPKILIAFFYGYLILLSSSVLIKFNGFYLLSKEEQLFLLPELIDSIFYLLILSFLLFVADSVINGMYSVLVQDYLNKKKLFFFKALRHSLSRFFVLIPALLVSVLFYTVIALIPSFILSYALLRNDFLLIFIGVLLILIAVFVSNVLFYLIYPVSVLEKNNFFSSVKKTVKFSLKDKKNISIASLIPFSLSVISWIFAFFQDRFEFLFLFAIGRFLVALIATYNYVINPLFYFQFQKKKKIRL